MSFVSYSQNFEDVMLWRALKHIENGFYIDVGANDPSIESVTKAFYEKGWKGINIEPLASHYSDLKSERERDVNLQCAAGEEDGVIDIWEADVRGWATASKEVIDRHEAEGHPGKWLKVPVRRLSDICEEFVQGDIHFLKIDVEGLEKSVIKGMDFSTYRPWILLIEATAPNSKEEVHADWESLVVNADYTFAYADGLNRYYVSNNHLDLLEALRYPPNVFDDFIRSEQINSELRAQQAEQKTLQAEQQALQAEQQALQAEQKALQAEQKALRAGQTALQAEVALQAVLDSRSWKLTQPLRTVMSCGLWFIQGSKAWLTFAPGSRPRRIVQSVLLHLKLYVSLHPRLKRFALKCLAPFPSLQARIKTLGLQEVIQPHSSDLFTIEGPENLSFRGRQIYHDLKIAIEKRLKEQA